MLSAYLSRTACYFAPLNETPQCSFHLCRVCAGFPTLASKNNISLFVARDTQLT